MSVKPIPDGYHTITPYLCVKGMPAFLEFMQQAFAAEVMFCHRSDDGTIKHSQIKIGDSIIMAGELDEKCAPSMPGMFYMYVNDVDDVYKKAVAAGGKSIREPENQFYGDRSGGVQDAFGNQWWVSTHVEDVDSEEIMRRASKLD